MPGLLPSDLLLVPIAVPCLLAALHGRGRLGAAALAGCRLVAGLVGLVWLVRIARIVQLRLTEPTQWDFLTFWLGARVAVQGGNFYDPASYAAQPLPLEPGGEFVREVLQVGYAYPPTSMLVMLPLGGFDYTTAYALWYGAMLLCLALAAWLLARTFLDRAGWEQTAALGLLVLLLHSSVATISYGQSNFLLLLLLLLFWRARDRSGGGVWLALAALVKPFAVLIVPWLVLRRYWRAIAGWGGTLAVAGLASLLLFGGKTFFAYFDEGVVGRFPFYVYTQRVNHSALAATLRWFDPGRIDPPYLLYPPFVLTAAVVIGLTLLATLRDRDPQGSWSLGAAFLAALLVYPNSLSHYAVITLIPLLALWQARGSLPGGAWLLAGLITVLYALNGSQGESAIFVANLLTWSVLVAMALRPAAPLPGAPGQERAQDGVSGPSPR